MTEIMPRSFRIGGMRTAHAMGGGSGMMMQHGRWMSAEAARRYVSHNLDKLTSVSRALHVEIAQAVVPKQAMTSSAGIAKNKKRRGKTNLLVQHKGSKHMWEVCPGGRLSYLPRGSPR